MAEGQEQEDKTEDASERRIEQALERGDVPRSADLGGFFTLTAGMVVTAMVMKGQGVEVVGSLGEMLGRSGQVALSHSTARDAMGLAGLAAVGPMLAVMVAAVVASLSLHRPMLTAEPLMPKLERISPGSGIKRMFGKESWIAFAKTLLKLAAVGAVLWATLWPEVGSLVRLIQLDPVAGVTSAAVLTTRMVVAVLVLYAFIAVADAVYQMLAWKKRLRMSLQEVKDETKESEGNPEIKAKLRALRQRRARQRIIAAVPKASVVLVNPTHYSVALRYEKGMRAPVCVAKGADELALKIREIARENRIPVVANPPLARALHATVEIDAEIAPEHYKAVAEIIGFVMRARKRR
jgi:flagellar biosynthetic protein FlhB